MSNEDRHIANAEDLYRNVYEHFFGILALYAYKFVNDKEAAADLVQTVFTKLWPQRANFTNENTLRAYLYTSVRNAALDYLKHHRRNSSLTPEEQQIPSSEDQEEALIRAELSRQLAQHIESLPYKARRILKMSLRGHSYQAIGEALKITISTVHSQRVRAVKLLREAFSKK